MLRRPGERAIETLSQEEITVPQKKERFADSRRLEDKYFHKKEQELIRKLKEKAAKEASRRELSESLNISDEGKKNIFAGSIARYFPISRLSTSSDVNSLHRY